MVDSSKKKSHRKGGLDTPTVHVQNWTRAWLLQFYASQPGVRDPQTPEVWEQWANAQLPPRVKDFAQRVFWHKLTVHERVYTTSGTDKCPICSQKELVKHPWCAFETQCCSGQIVPNF